MATTSNMAALRKLPNSNTGRLTKITIPAQSLHGPTTGSDPSAFGIGVMINRDSRGHSYFIVRGEILGFMKTNSAKAFAKDDGKSRTKVGGSKTIRYVLVSTINGRLFRVGGDSALMRNQSLGFRGEYGRKAET
ncbi:hypothetical protein KIW84_UN0131 [Lathyrus oleraceus]|nr:hypothetical protein KIW84_UN0131 [Pisum sativum]